MANADRIIELLHEAKARPAGAERERFLAEACRDDAALKEQIVSLIEAEANDGDSDFLKHTPLIRQTARVTEKPGDRIGRYKLLEQIGEGGCGVVYMAEQEEPVRRRVALKVIKLGMDTRQVIARFEAERQALALMDHPNIAKVHDGGATDTGRPFFVMELVRGIKITDYCDQNNLTTDQRLELFTQVCHAVQHAHQKGIIHRDLKPSNLLVTLHDGVPVPKVIDFGIAKATSDQRLTDKTLFTAFEQFVGTPAYMSPEQAEMSGLDIDTRSDIYSLGVLLYELLTGRTPLDPGELLRSGVNEMRRKIREDEPSRPSTRLSTMQARDLTAIAKHRQADAPKLIHLVRGDLDWIVMKCLEKDRARRYETANGLAADLKRHLQNEPVTACPPSRAYQFQKLVRRNKLAFASGAALAVTLIIGIVVSTLQALRATRAEREQSRLRLAAQAEAAKSQQVAAFLKDMLASVGPSVAMGRDATMLREVLEKAARRVGTDLKEQPAVQAELQSTIGRVYFELGDFRRTEAIAEETLRLQKTVFGETSEQVADTLTGLAFLRHQEKRHKEAETLHREAIGIREKLSGREHPKLTESLCGLGDTLNQQGKNAEAEAAYRESLELGRKLFGNEHISVIDALNQLMVVLSNQGKMDAADAAGREALTIGKKAFSNGHPSVATSMLRLATVVTRRGQLDEAESLFREAAAMRTRFLGEAHPWVASARDWLIKHLIIQKKLAEAETLARAEVALRRSIAGGITREASSALGGLAQTLAAQGNFAEAETLRREELALEKKLSGEEHPFVANSLHELGIVLGNAGKWTNAETVFLEAAAMRRKLLGGTNLPLANSLHWLGDSLWAQEKRNMAESRFRESWNIYRKLLGDEHARTALALQRVSLCLSESGRWAESELLLREVLAVRRKTLSADAPNLASTLAELTRNLLRQEKFAEAEPLARECLAVREKQLPDDWRTFDTRSLLGGSLLGQKKYSEAEPLLLSGYEGLKRRENKMSADGKTRIKETIQSIIKLYEATAQPEKVNEWRTKLRDFESGEAFK